MGLYRTCHRAGGHPGVRRVNTVELKPWIQAHKTPQDAVVTTAFKGGQQQVNHPSYWWMARSWSLEVLK